MSQDSLDPANVDVAAKALSMLVGLETRCQEDDSTINYADERAALLQVIVLDRIHDTLRGIEASLDNIQGVLDSRRRD